MKFILNKTSGINGIEKVSLEKIIQTFSVPKNIEINIDKSNILDIGLKYEDINLAIFYVINFIIIFSIPFYFCKYFSNIFSNFYNFIV